MGKLTDLSGAYLEGANFRGAKFTGARLDPDWEFLLYEK
ncbi:pentapeptide repeat-containing protein [Cylindrospermopsis sp. CR12]